MGDSEEEFDRQRREKFRRERSDIYERRGDRGDWGHDRPRGWAGGNMDRGPMRPPPGDQMPQRHRHDYSNPPPDMKRRFSPGRRDEDNGPRKRIRGVEPPFGQPDWRNSPGWDHRRSGFRPPDEWNNYGSGPGDTGGRMLTFKQWLSSQPDDIGDEEAVKNYTEYKTGFKRQQLQQFFRAHKDEEWFKEKYHPEESKLRKDQHIKDVRLRADTFKALQDKGLMDNISLDLTDESKIVHLLDAAVIFLEGGQDEDLKVLSSTDEPSSSEVNGKAEADSEDKTDAADADENHAEKDDELKKAKLFKQLVSDESQNSEKHDTPDDAESKTENVEESGSSAAIEENGSEKNSKIEEVKTIEPKMLHQTYSVFMRSLPPSVTRCDIINLCKKYEGFLRVAFSQPLEDHNRFIRRCWVTFRRNVNIKDICWNLNNIRLREMELNPVVNRDLARRVRPISGIAQHKVCAKSDLKNVVRLIQHLDKKMMLWIDNDADSTGASTAESKNPWLANISEFLVEETSAEEDMLLGPEVDMPSDVKDDGMQTTNVVDIQRDGRLIQKLDLLLLYLRLVHSVDYYNASQYPNEDEMPNRCGIVHARGPVPPNKLTKDDIGEFQKRFSEKLVAILDFKEMLTSEDAKKLGLKDEDAEVEKFVTANTQELGKDKWLCPLSGKKFKGPDYVRKHIFNKHADKIEAVKNEVAYFNNYLYDPSRPGPPEGQPSPGASGPPGMPAGYPPFGVRPPMYGEPPFGHFSSPQYRPRMPQIPYGGGKTYPPKQRDMRQKEPYAGRPVIEYRDLDAPEDTDFF